MGLIDLVKYINNMFPKPPVHTEEEMRNIEKEIVSRYAQGNISLHLGKYVTTKEIARRKAELANYQF
jgi:hypothetical protein